jgi:hypothetical protein
MPAAVKKFCAKHSLLIDLLTTLATYITLGNISSSLVSAFAAAWVGLFFEIYMYIERNPEDFDWLRDIMETVKLHLRELQNKLREMNRSYKERKNLEAGVADGQDKALRVMAT